MPVYSKELMICATAYIRANSPEQAMEMFRDLHGNFLELREDYDVDLPISGRQYDDPELPEVSISPAVTVYANDEHCGPELPDCVHEDEDEEDEAE